LVLFGLAWFVTAFFLLINLWKVWRKHRFLVSLYMKIRGARREDIVDLVVDVISLYRGYHSYVLSLSIITLIIGISMIGYAASWRLVMGIPASEFLFRISIGIVTTVYAFFSLYLSEVWMGKRLNKGRLLEDRLDEFLGDKRNEA